MVILHQKNAEIIGLDELGGRIFDMMDGRRTLGEIVDLLLGDYDVSREKLLVDVIAFAGELETAGLLSRREGR